MMLAQQDTGAVREIAEALTGISGSVWLLLAVLAIIVAVKFFAAVARKAVIFGVLVGLFVLMNGPGMTGSGVAERWNDAKAKAEAFWNAENVRFDRQG